MLHPEVPPASVGITVAPSVSIFTDPSISELNARIGQGRKHEAAVRLVKAEYLISLWTRGEKLTMRQDTPEESFYDGPIGPGTGIDIVAVSYGWLTKEHPDPDSFHLGTLAPLLRAYEATYECGVAVFLDFVSLPQNPRTDAEDALFKCGLNAINLLYGQQHVMVWCLTRMPPGAANSYADRGWCIFEQTIASALKEGTYLIDVGRLKVDPSTVKDFAAEVIIVCMAGRSPPLTADTFSEVLSRKRFTNGKTDQEIVLGMYALFVREALGMATALDFNYVRWGPSDAQQLAKVLPLCSHLRRLELGINSLGDEGVRALAGQLPGGLEALILCDNKITAAGARALHSAGLPATLKELSLDYNKLTCIVANARTRKAVEQQARFFRGEQAAVTREVEAERRQARKLARTTSLERDGLVVPRQLLCTGRRNLNTYHQEWFKGAPCLVIAPVLLLTGVRLTASYWRRVDRYRGEWLLSTDEPLVNGAPHYERTLGGWTWGTPWAGQPTVHLYLYWNPGTNNASWKVGPTPGSNVSTVTSRVTSAMQPANVDVWAVLEGPATPCSASGYLYNEDPGFAFVDREAGRHRQTKHGGAEDGWTVRVARV